MTYNEGGYAFPNNIEPNPGNGDWGTINELYFQYVDIRMQYLFDHGFLIAGHPSWLSTTEISLVWAKHIYRYLLARYNAYNTVWSLTGEYQFSRDNTYSLESPSEWDSLGYYVQLLNPYKHLVTIHPTYGGPSYMEPSRCFSDYSSSGDYHHSSWMDINWIQTYAWIEDVSESVYHDYCRIPKKPVIMAEPGYEYYPSLPWDQQIYSVLSIRERDIPERVRKA